jgi:hypothetical protein
MKLTTLLPLLLVAACITRPAPECVVPNLEPETIIIREDVSHIFQPILLSRRDVLTEGTQNQVRDHNNIYWCLFPDKQPPNFDVAICD